MKTESDVDTQAKANTKPREEREREKGLPCSERRKQRERVVTMKMMAFASSFIIYTID